MLNGRYAGVGGKNTKKAKETDGSCKDSESGQLHKTQFNKEKWLPLATLAPFAISHYCCATMKKSPIKIYERETGCKPFIGTLAEESSLREQAWIRKGCNAFNSSHPTSQPLSFWTEQDILQYISQQSIPLASVYGEIVCVDGEGNEYDPKSTFGFGKLKCTGCDRTGCIFCGFGAHLDKVPRFVRLKETHPKQYDYCMMGGEWSDNPAYVMDAEEYDGEWKNWNPKKIWTPKDGLGMAKVFDMVNEIYGKEMIRY